MSLVKKLVLLVSFVLVISGCNKKQHPANQVIVGTISGPETTLMEVAADVAKQKYQLNIKIVPFNDYVLPNQALAEGSLDANVFQHLPYLQSTIKAKGYLLAAIGKTFVYPMGIYSKKIKSLTAVPKGATVAIPNDPSNQARALLLLDKAGLIRLKPNTGINASLKSIKDNPHQLTFKEMDAAGLPRVLDDVTLAAINTNYAMVAGLMPKRDALFTESANSPYANVIVVRKVDEHKKQLQELVKALHSQAVLDKAQELFKGQAIPAWEKEKK